MDLSKRRAFTLIELLISCAILAFVVAGIWYIIIHSRRNARITSAKHRLEQEIRLILDHLNMDLSAGIKGSFDEDFVEGTERSGESWDLRFEVTQGADNEAGEVIYTFKENILVRSGQSSGDRYLSRNLTECSLVPEISITGGGTGAPPEPFKGKVSITVAGKIIPYSQHEGVEFNEGTTVVIRELARQDKRWKSTINTTSP
ncbi:MAG: prepilin-type N-terminal cleavage/methylation domain-containing protein [bacterium]|nr:prepilin-type N-terminal cleavage/methylation domain-containing protein [bacterium]